MSEVGKDIIKAPLQGTFTIDAFNLINQHGDTINIQEVVSEFTLNESIYNKFCSATLAMSDGLNFPKNYRLTGQEFVHIVIKQIRESLEEKVEVPIPTTIDKLFRIYKIQALTQQGQMTQNYVINLCEPRLFSCRRNRVSRVFRGSYNKILKKILVEEAKIPESNLEVGAGEYEGENWEKTDPDNIQFIAPNWTVGSVIDYCVNNASLGDEGVYKNGMFFYQTLTGGFRFKSIDEMFNASNLATAQDIEFSQAPRNIVQEEGADDVPLDDKKGFSTQVFTMSKPQLFDTLAGTVAGAYASKRITYDPIWQMTREEVFDLEETWNRGPDKHLSGYPLIHTDGERIMDIQDYFSCPDPATIPDDENLPPNKHPDSFVSYGNTMTHSYDNLGHMFPEVFIAGSGTSNKLERRAMLELLNQHRIVITIPLRTDLSVGTIIKVIQGPMAPKGLDLKDELNDQRYLITDIAVKGNPQMKRGVMDIECVKESFAMKISDAHHLASQGKAVSIVNDGGG